MKLLFRSSLRKGKVLPIGTKRKFGKRWYVKTSRGWKYSSSGEGGIASKSSEKHQQVVRDRNSKIVEMAQEGSSTEEISREVGLSKPRVLQLLTAARKSGLVIERKEKRRITLNERFEYIHRKRRSAKRNRSGEALTGQSQPYEDDGIKLGRSHISKRPDTNYISEDLRGSLRQHQQDFVNLAMQRFEDGEKSMYNFDSAGTGKSRQQIALAETYLEHNPDKSVIIVTENERVMIDAFAKDGRAMQVKMTPITTSSEVKGPGIYISKYSRLSDIRDASKKADLLIFDEAHNLKNASLSTKAKEGIDLIKAAPHVALFTATPIDKADHLEYLSAAAGLDFSQVVKFLGFRRRGNSWVTTQSASFVAEKLDAVFSSFFEKGVMVKREVPLEGLQMDIHTIKMSPESRRKYNQSVKRMAIDLQLASIREKGLVKAKWLMKIRGVLEEAKIDHAVASVKNAIDNGRQVVLFATRVNESKIRKGTYIPSEQSVFAKLNNRQVGEIKTLLDSSRLSKKEIALLYEVHPRTIDRISKKQTWKYVDMSGKESPDAGMETFTAGTLREISQRLANMGIKHASVFGSNRKAQKDIAKFQRGDLKVVLTTANSGGTGLNLDDTTGNAPREAIVLTPPFSAVEFLQMPGRIHRLTTKSASKVTFISTDTSVERWNKDIVANKLVSLGASVKGDYANISISDLEKTEAMSPEKAEQYMKDVKKRGAVPTKSTFKFNISDFMKSLLMYGGKIMRRVHVVHLNSIGQGWRSVMRKAKYDPDELAIGTRIEMEHTNDPRKARKIAMDHLDEFPRYYSEVLVPAEKKAEQNKVIDEAVASYFKNNPNPSDRDFHQWAEEAGFKTDAAEQAAYRLASQHVKMHKSTKAKLVLFQKGKKRPIGYVSPGGYKKTKSGWIKVSGGATHRQMQIGTGAKVKGAEEDYIKRDHVKEVAEIWKERRHAERRKKLLNAVGDSGSVRIVRGVNAYLQRRGDSLWISSDEEGDRTLAEAVAISNYDSADAALKDLMSTSIVEQKNLSKGKKAEPEGTIKEWGGKQYKKVSGKWIPYVGKTTDKGRKKRFASKVPNEEKLRNKGEVSVRLDVALKEGASDDYGEEGYDLANHVAEYADNKWTLHISELDEVVEGKNLLELSKNLTKLISKDADVKSVKLASIK